MFNTSNLGHVVYKSRHFDSSEVKLWNHKPLGQQQLNLSQFANSSGPPTYVSYCLASGELNWLHP